MNAADQNVHLAAEALNATIKPFPASEKVYVEGSRPDIRVPFRKDHRLPIERKAEA